MIDQGGLVFKVTSAVPISSTITTPDTYDRSTGVLYMYNVSIAADNFEVEMIHQEDLVFKFVSSLKVNFKFITSYLNGVPDTNVDDFPYSITSEGYILYIFLVREILTILKRREKLKII